ncbi:MAG TPA: hypothetical protein VFH74_13020 [Gaiellales bacterium]|nr:hypothetical protein [Gaiellales bacterium]
MKLFRRGDENEPVDVIRTEKDAGTVLLEVLRRRKLSPVAVAPKVFQLVGNSSSVDFWMTTTVSIDGTAPTFGCSLPIPVDGQRLEAMMELCLWLSARSRVRFAVDHACPYANLDADVGLMPAGQAFEVINESIRLLWKRMAGYAGAFHAIADGSDVETALDHVDGEMLNLLRPRPWSNDPPSAARWPSLGEESLPLPTPEETKEGYTPEEYRITLLLIGRLARSPRGIGVQAACAGPIMIHADGVVECFGCADPAETPHLSGTTIACEWWRQVGRGHVCDRCDPAGKP